MARSSRDAHGLSIAKYAEHRRKLGLPGHAKSTVQKMLQRGVITRNSYGKIDPEKADAQWMENADPAKRRGELEKGNGKPTGYQAHRTKREEYEAKKSEVEFHQLAGTVLDRETLAEELFAIGRAWRDHMLNLVGRYQDKIPAKIRKELEAEIREACEEVTRGPRSI